MRRIKYLILGIGFFAQIVSYSEDAGVGIDREVLAGDTAADDLVTNLQIAISCENLIRAVIYGSEKEREKA